MKSKYLPLRISGTGTVSQECNMPYHTYEIEFQSKPLDRERIAPSNYRILAHTEDFMLSELKRVLSEDCNPIQILSYAQFRVILMRGIELIHTFDLTQWSSLCGRYVYR